MSEPFDHNVLRTIRLVIVDVDGVMTDGSITVNPDGSEQKTFNVKDGSGIKYLQRSDVKVAILSGRKSEPVDRRAEDLGIEHCRTGFKIKLPAYEDILEQVGVPDEAVCYIGDDLPDIPPMRRAGVPIAVADAVDEVKSRAAYVTAAPGGRGAVREVAEMILRAQGKWETVMERYL